MARYTTADLQNVINKKKDPPACDTKIQVEVFTAEDGLAKGTWTVDESFLNGHKVAMGGFVSAAADVVLAYAINSVLSEDESFASIDLDTTFHRPVFAGKVNIQAKVNRRGRKTAYLTATLEQNDKVVADTVSSALIMGN